MHQYIYASTHSYNNLLYSFHRLFADTIFDLYLLFDEYTRYYSSFKCYTIINAVLTIIYLLLKNGKRNLLRVWSTSTMGLLDIGYTLSMTHICLTTLRKLKFNLTLLSKLIQFLPTSTEIFLAYTRKHQRRSKF